MSDDLMKRLRELRSNQYADPNTAPEFVFLDPDLPPSEWEKQFGMDVVYIRADRIEELEAKLAKAVEALERIEDASRYFGSNPEASETTVRYAHETTRRLCSTTLAELKGKADGRPE